MIRSHHAHTRRFAAAVLHEASVKTYRNGPPEFESDDHALAWLHNVGYRCSIDKLSRVDRSPSRRRMYVQLLIGAGTLSRPRSERRQAC